MQFGRNKKEERTTYSLLRSGVYRLHDVEDEEIDRIRGAKVAYSFWSAAKYTFILTVLLWWLPVFGQMIAGYVGGRRAGTPGRAIVAALMPLVFIFVISYAFDSGLIPSQIDGIVIDPEALMNGAGENIPFVGPYLAFATMYIKSWMGAVQSITLLKVDNYIVTIAFAYIGGIIADQTRREMEFIAVHSGHETNIVVGREAPLDQAPPRARTLRYTSPSRRVEQVPSFEDLSPLEGSASVEDEAEVPVRITKKRVGDGGLLEKKDVKKNIRLMKRAQQEVERKAKPTSRGHMSGLVERASKKSSKVKSAEQESPGGWEYI